jgi:hypothetical protein
MESKSSKITTGTCSHDAPDRVHDMNRARHDGEIDLTSGSRGMLLFSSLARKAFSARLHLWMFGLKWTKLTPFWKKSASSSVMSMNSLSNINTCTNTQVDSPVNWAIGSDEVPLPFIALCEEQSPGSLTGMKDDFVDVLSRSIDEGQRLDQLRKGACPDAREAEVAVPPVISVVRVATGQDQSTESPRMIVWIRIGIRLDNMMEIDITEVPTEPLGSEDVEATQVQPGLLLGLLSDVRSLDDVEVRDQQKQ